MACAALGVVGDADTFDYLREVVVRDSDIHVRLAAIEALKKLGRRHKEQKTCVAEILEGVADELIRIDSDIDSRALGHSASEAAHNLKAEKGEATKQKLLFGEEELPPIVSREFSKADVFDVLEKDLARVLDQSGVSQDEIEYVTRIGISIKRKAAVVKSRKKEAVKACEICESPFFEKRDGKLFSHLAHVHALKDGGADSIENTLLLCPNCHAQLDMARDTKITHTENIIHIQLPDKTEATFQISAGQAPQKIA